VAEDRKVAIVDDDSGVRESLRFLLEVMSHAAEAFESAAEFLKQDVERFTCLILVSCR
jgi:FixJ family two-component response regulator